MSHLFNRITVAILNLVNPYTDADQPPSDNVWLFIRSHLPPLKRIIILSVVSTIVAAALEVWLISYTGQLIDMISDTPPQEIWQKHGVSLLLAALAILLLRPLLQFARYSANDIGLDCNIANLVRWRAHDHLSQQSVGWFQEDLTGRTTSRLIDIGNYTATIIYESLNIIAFGLVYMIGIVTLMAGTDIRLALPLFIWVVLYITLVGVIVPRMVKAQRQFQAARSALVGRVVDCFSNFDTVKLFSRSETIAEGFKVDLEATRQTLLVPRQLSIGLRTLVMLIESLMMVALVGYGIWLWSVGSATIGLIASALALVFRISALAEWVIGAIWMIFRSIGSLGDALKTVSQPLQIPPKHNPPILIGVTH